MEKLQNALKVWLHSIWGGLIFFCLANFCGIYAQSIIHDTSVIPSRALQALTQPTNPIHNSTPAGQNAMNVGIPVHLILDPGGGALTDIPGITWTISAGSPIKDYEISSFDPANPEDPDGNIRGYLTVCNTQTLNPAADLQGVTEISFYYTETGTSVVIVTAEINGSPVPLSITFNVLRDPKAEIYYVTGNGGFSDDTAVEDRDNIMGEHWYWHDTAEDVPGFANDNPGRFFHFHRGYIGKFNCWRGIFGYECVLPYIPGPNHLPSGRSVEHVGVPGDGNGIVSQQRVPSPGIIPPLPLRFSINGDGTMKLSDFPDENVLYSSIVGYHDAMHTTYLCSTGDFLSATTTPADPIFWRFHFMLTKVHELWQLLRLEGKTLTVLGTGPGGTQVFYPDPDIRFLPNCSGSPLTSCTPAAGSIFPIGTTPVTCTATDVVLLDPSPDPNPAMQEAIVGPGTTQDVNFEVRVLDPAAPTTPADIILILDDTGSMTGTTPAGPGGGTPTKIQALKDAITTFTAILREHREGAGDNIGVFTFKVPPGADWTLPCQNSWSNELVPFGPLDDRVQDDPLNPVDINANVSTMPADGDATPIRIGIEEASTLLQAQPANRTPWIILMTDGKQNTDNCLISAVKEPEFNNPQVLAFRNTFLETPGINFAAVGFGAGNAINGPLLQTLATGPDDYFDFASQGTGSLSKWFNAAVALLLNHQEVVDPQGVIRTGENVTTKVPLTSTSRSATFILTWAGSGRRFPPALSVKSPGSVPLTITEADHDPSIGINWTTGDVHKILVLRFPLGGAFAGYHHGVWEANVHGPRSRSRADTVEYTLGVLSDEALHLNCTLPDSAIATNESFILKATLTGQALLNAKVTVEITGLQQNQGSQLSLMGLKEKDILSRTTAMEPSAGLQARRMEILEQEIRSGNLHRKHTTQTDTLYDDGKHNDGKAGDGIFAGTVKPLKSDGAYSVLFRAEGVTYLGDRFQRECSMGFYAATAISSNQDDIHIHPVDTSGLVFDYDVRPTGGGFHPALLGPGYAASFVVDVTDGKAGDVVDHGDGTYTVRITRDTKDVPAQVSISIRGNHLASFQLPPAPHIVAVTPADGPGAGGNSVRIHGTYFHSDADVHFGSRQASKVTFISESLIEVVAPAGSGVVSVKVTNPDKATGELANAYAYHPTSGITPFKWFLILLILGCLAWIAIRLFKRKSSNNN